MTTITTQAPPAGPRTWAPPAPGRHPGTVDVREETAPTITQPPESPRPWMNGGALLTNVSKWLKRYLYLDSEAKYTALALWIAGSHFRDEKGDLVHETFPIAGFLSAEPGSGKTHALECLSILCPGEPSILTEPSEAAIAGLIGDHHATILLDEGDILFGAGRRKAAIRAILNSGYKKGGTWPRVRNGDVRKLPTYGAKAIAALLVAKTGTGSMLDALFTRIVEWEMHQPPPGTVLHKLREVFAATGPDGQAHRVTGRDIGRHLAAQLADWAAQERTALAASVPQVPGGVELREEEKWLPLLAVAERAHANREAIAIQRARAAGRDEGDEKRDGDDWRALALAACADMSLYGGTPDAAPQYTDVMTAIMDEWDAVAPASEPAGQIVYADDPGDEPPAPPQPAPAAQYSAGYARTQDGTQPEVKPFPGTWPSLQAAQWACEGHAAGEYGTGPLPWEPGRPGFWGATIHPGGPEGPEVSYAVHAAGGE